MKKRFKFIINIKNKIIFILLVLTFGILMLGEIQISKASSVNNSLNKNEVLYYDERDGIYRKKPATQVDLNNPETEFIEPVLKNNIVYDLDSDSYIIVNRINIFFENIMTHELAKEFGLRNNLRLVGQTVEYDNFTYELPNISDINQLKKYKKMLQQQMEVRLVDYSYPPQKFREDIIRLEQVKNKRKRELLQLILSIFLITNLT